MFIKKVCSSAILYNRIQIELHLPYRKWTKIRTGNSIRVIMNELRDSKKKNTTKQYVSWRFSANIFHRNTQPTTSLEHGILYHRNLRTHVTAGYAIRFVCVNTYAEPTRGYMILKITHP